jgi:Tol biopolymer transport system component
MSIDRRFYTAGGGIRLAAIVTLLTIVAGVATAVIVRSRRRASPIMPALRLSLEPPDELADNGSLFQLGLALSPDGRRLVFAAANDGTTQLWMRDLSQGDVQPLVGTSGGVLPFWSPDGGAVAFFAATKLRVFRFDDGSVQDLADAPSPQGGTWHPNGDILFAPEADIALLRRQPSGTVTSFTTLLANESSHRHPRLARDGLEVVFYVRSPESPRQGIWMARYDQPATRQRLVGSDAHGVVVDDALLYASDSALVAQRVDFDKGALVGRTVLLGTSVGRGPQNELFASAAADVLVFGTPSSGLRELRWFDRDGRVAGVLGEPMTAADVRLAPAANAVAVTRADPQMKTFDIWVYEGDRPLPRRLSSSVDSDDSPAWSRDGARLAWVSGRRSVTTRAARAELPEMPLHTFMNSVRVTDWSPDSQWIVVSESQPRSRSDILLLPSSGKGGARVYAQSPFNESQGVVSSDGRWLAYASDESGRFEIYVDAFPAPGRRARLTVGGGTAPRWSGTSRALYFSRGTEIHTVQLTLDGATAEALSSTRLFDAGAEIRAYDVTPDANRFLLNLPAGEGVAKPMTVIVNVGRLLPTVREVTEARIRR